MAQSPWRIRIHIYLRDRIRFGINLISMKERPLERHIADDYRMWSNN